MSSEIFPPQEFSVAEEEKKILEGVEPGLVSILELVSRRLLTEKPE